MLCTKSEDILDFNSSRLFEYELTNCYLKFAFSEHCERHESSSTISDLHWQEQNKMFLLEKKILEKHSKYFKFGLILQNYIKEPQNLFSLVSNTI